jgi:hypothetical protein
MGVKIENFTDDWLQKSVELLLAQAKDFAKTYTIAVIGEKAPVPSSVVSA